jgi:hypothetical protein
VRNSAVAAIENLTLSDPNDVIDELTVYVYGNLGRASDSVAPTGDVKAIGTVTLKGAATTVLFTATTIDVSGAVIGIEAVTHAVTLLVGGFHICQRVQSRDGTDADG